MNPLLLSFILTTVMPAIGYAGYTIISNGRTKKYEAAIQEWAPVIFDVVNNMVQQNPNLASRKSALFIQRLTEVLETKKIKVTPTIITQARAIAESIHYQDKRSQAQQSAILGPFPVPPGA